MGAKIQQKRREVEKPLEMIIVPKNQLTIAVKMVLEKEKAVEKKAKAEGHCLTARKKPQLMARMTTKQMMRLVLYLYLEAS